MNSKLFQFSRLAAAGLFLSACEDAAPNLSGEALDERRIATREMAAQLLRRPEDALLGREDLVIRDERLIQPALDHIMSNLEKWIPGDEHRLRSFLETQVISARNELLTSPDGIASLDQLAKAAFARPKVEVHEGMNPARPASDLEKKASQIAGTILSGRPSEARDLPASHWTEVWADFGLIPVPLEENPRNKHSVSLLRHRQDAAGDWLEEGQPECPRLAVVERISRDLLRQHPKASRLVISMQVLRTIGAPVTWEFMVIPAASGGGIEISGTGSAPGFHGDFGTHLCPAP